jgi:CRP-like cAMP-binding protein
MSEQACPVCEVEGGCLFSSLSGETLRRFKADRVIRPYHRGQVVFYRGDEPAVVFCVQSGSVKLFKSRSRGREVVTRLLGPCDVAGYRPILANERHSDTAEVIEDSTLCLIPKETFLQIMQHSRELHAAVVKLMAVEWRLSDDFWSAHASDNVEERVVTLLERLSGHGRRPPVHGGTLNTRIPRVEMARAVGITPSTLSRVLKILAERGIVGLHPRSIDILSPKSKG